jgi:hypothetical protein
MKNFSKSVIAITLILSASLPTMAQNFFAGGGAGTGNTGTQVTGVGASSISTNNSGASNSGLGYQSLKANSSGANNSAVGSNAMLSNTTGAANTAVGSESLRTNTTGSNQSAFGYRAAYNSNASGPNDAFGHEALFSNTSGYWNTAFGYRALYSNTSALYNVGIGAQALYTNTTGTHGVAVGFDALLSNTTGSDNTAVGYAALFSNTSATENTALGFSALRNVSSGSNNTAIGNNCGQAYSSYTNCTFLGSDADANKNGLTNSMALGFASVVDSSNKTVIGNSGTLTTGYYGTLVALSDGRFKREIKENVPGMDFINKLRPVTYYFDIHKLDQHLYGDKAAEYEKAIGSGIAAKEKIRYTGFIAQEVEQAAQSIKYDFSGVVKPQTDKGHYGVDYSEFVVPIVKGMQEQQQMIEEQKSLIKQQQGALEQAMQKIASLSDQLQDIRECCSSGNIIKDKNDVINIPAAKLLKAVPNPTSNNSTIYYFVPETASGARIELKNWDGKTLQSINAENLGNSSVTIQTDKLSAGIYYYSLFVGEKLIETKTISVVKN